MNWNKIIVVMSTIALALIAIPAANAQRGHRGSAAGGGRAQIGASSARTFQARAGRGNGRSFVGRGANFRNRTGRVANFRNQSGSNRHWRGRHRGRHHRSYYYYPYYSYYPYGYPFWGTSFYFGTSPYYSRGYYSAGDGSVVVEIQRELARAGYYHGAIDGIIGSGTRRAIRLYERSRGLPVDGRIDSDLLATMGLS